MSTQMASRCCKHTKAGVGLLQVTRSLNHLLKRILAPIQSFVKYEINAEHATDHRKFSKYSGPPREELEDAWGALIRRM